MGYTVFQAGELAFEPRGEDDPRMVAQITDALEHSRANVWRYPPGVQGSGTATWDRRRSSSSSTGR